MLTNTNTNTTEQSHTALLQEVNSSVSQDPTSRNPAPKQVTLPTPQRAGPAARMPAGLLRAPFPCPIPLADHERGRSLEGSAGGRGGRLH